MVKTAMANGLGVDSTAMMALMLYPAKAIGGKKLTVEEWEARFAEEPAKDLFDFNYKEAA